MRFLAYSRLRHRLRSLSRRRAFGILFCSVITLIAIATNACQTQAGIVPALPQHPNIQVFFNQNQAARYTDPYRNIERLGDNLERVMIDQVNKAKVSLDIAVQELRLPNISKAIVDAKLRGVNVRLILENQYSRAWSEFTPEEVAKMNARDRDRYKDFQKFADINNDGRLSDDELDRRDGLRLIKAANVPWIDDTADGSKGSGLMHHKFIIIDEQVIVFGSANYTMSDIHGDFTKPETRGNANNLLVVGSKELARYFKKEFNLMWGDGPNGKPDSLFGTKKRSRKIEYLIVGGAQFRIKFSPDSLDTAREQTSSGLITTAISGSKNSVDMALFVYSDPYISTILEERQQQNVQIRTLVDPQFAYRDYSSTLDMWSLQSTQDCKTGKSSAWKQPLKTVGIPNLVSGDTLHHKYGIIDRNLILTGSHNWTNAANHVNDEFLVAIQNDIVAAHFQREFDRLYKDATFGPTAKLSQATAKSCADRLKGKNKPQEEDAEF
ncbi:competence protein ComE [Pseudanabaena sp. FACHB-1998]|uniref:phospholipase D-like domain-containing protein n=1 Tax=Pseudanabaena sp. FACHB-1998 TaxID=2692858 RepID=UPI001681A99C|nr:phospholipase D-like domain-containing protein [Pseudanabaena sp. FACHB-1998]MBD2176474.1 competence protein ComE [Pseudanabaena sp. FACHB-1998]